MKKSKKYFIGANIFIIILLSVVSTYYQNKYVDGLNKEYRDISKSDEIIGVIKVIELFKMHPLITLVDGNKIFLHTGDNYNYSEENLGKFLMQGDTLLKHRGSDTIFINREQKTYFFIIGADVGKDPYKINIDKWFKK